MKYFEFGTSNPELLVILHGGGASYRGAEPSARLLSQKYHVVLVAYDGFNPTEPDTVFQSPMDEAQRVGDYLVEHYGGLAGEQPQRFLEEITLAHEQSRT